MVNEPQRIASRANPLLVQLRRLLHDGAAYRRYGLLWVEGENLCAAAVAHGVVPQRVVFSDAGWARPELRRLAQAAPVALLPDALFAEHSSLESPPAVGMVLAVPAAPALQPQVATVVLDRLQDAGNAGSILRSAAAFGVRQVLALKGTVALWSPKVLRAGMGAHFALALVEGCGAIELEAIQLPLLATSSHAGEALHRARLPAPAAWVFGHEGQGVSAALAARCAALLRIEQPGGQESLNVAAAAAICLYESSRHPLPSQ